MAAHTPPPQKPQNQPLPRLSDALPGTWRLVSWLVYDDAPFADPASPGAHAPFGDDATGVLVYTADGTMSALITRSGRAPFAGSPRGSDERSRAQAFDSAFAYAGRYHLEGDDQGSSGLVVHDVTHALNPNFVGTRQARHAVLSRGDDDGGLTLTLSAAEGTRHHRLVWSRP
jgi:hypothetical protein